MKFYKFLCPFVKISPYSSESLEKSLDKVVSRGEKNFSVHKKYMNFLRPRKTALDELLYKLSAGRSMVEMLGVLAIIGVLSVGAIAGYSKAMTKYKLNKQTEQLSQLLSGMIEYKNILYETNSSEQVTYMLPYYKKLNIIPQEMIKDNTDYIYDSFNNQILIYRDNTSKQTFIRFYNSDIDSCINRFNLAKGFAYELQAIGFNGTDSNDENQQQWLYGKTCSNQDYCIYSADISTIWNLCNQCLKGNICVVYYVFK